jgi:hypothetical protein
MMMQNGELTGMVRKMVLLRDCKRRQLEHEVYSCVWEDGLGGIGDEDRAGYGYVSTESRNMRYEMSAGLRVCSDMEAGMHRLRPWNVGNGCCQWALELGRGDEMRSDDQISTRKPRCVYLVDEAGHPSSPGAEGEMQEEAEDKVYMTLRDHL